MQPKDCQGKAREVTHLMILNPNHAFKLDSVHHACETSIESSNFVHQKTCSKIISAGFTNKSNCTTHLSWKEMVKRVTRTKASSWILIFWLPYYRKASVHKKSYNVYIPFPKRPLFFFHFMHKISHTWDNRKRFTVPIPFQEFLRQPKSIKHT